MVTSSVVPAAGRLLWLFLPELECLEGESGEASAAAAAVASLEGVGGPTPLPSLSTAIETASMSVADTLSVLCSTYEKN